MTEHISNLKSRVETLDHHFEHQLSSVEDHIKSLLGKLNEREDLTEDRIDELEAMVKKVAVLCSGAVVIILNNIIIIIILKIFSSSLSCHCDIAVTCM